MFSARDLKVFIHFHFSKPILMKKILSLALYLWRTLKYTFIHSFKKVASEILYNLSKKNQVVFSTHSPNLIFNFSTKQIREVILNEEYYTDIRQNTDIDMILNDLGYTANDLMNVSFVFIVEGKQDSNRLPLLLKKYYSEIN